MSSGNVEVADADGSPKPGLTLGRHLALAVVFLAALTFRGAYLWGQAQNNPLFDHAAMDVRVHHEWAQQIASGEGMGDKPYFRAPLYYYLLAGLYKLAGPNMTVGRVAGVILGALTCFLIARLGVLLAGFGAGLLAGLLAAFYWPFVYFDAELLTVGLEVLLDVGLLIVLLVAAGRNSLLLFFLGGLVWGLSAITRPNVLALAPIIVAWPWVASCSSGRRLRRLLAAGLTCLGGALLVAPVTIRNFVVSGESVLVATNGGVNFYIGNNPNSNGYAAIVPGTRPDWWGGYVDTHRIPERELGRKLTEAEVSDYWYDKGWGWIRSSPGDWLKHLFHKFRLFWSPVELPNNQPIWFFARMSQVSALFWIGFPMVACLGIGGLVLLLPQWRTWFLPLAFLIIYLVTVVAFFCSARYRLPVIPVLIVATAAGLWRLGESFRSRRVGRIAAYVVVCGLCALAVATNPPEDRKAFRALSDAEAHYNVGIYYARGAPGRTPDYARAMEHLEAALRLHPRLTNARLAKGYTLLELKRPDEAGREFAGAVAQHPQNAEARLYYGDYLTSAGKIGQAVEQYLAVVRVEPWNAEAHERLGILLNRARRDAEAIRHLRRALEIQPDLAPARHALARALANQGNLEAAVREFREVVRREATNVTALEDLAGILAKLGRSEEAIPYLYEAVRHDPARSSANEALAVLLSQTGRYSEAIGVLRNVTQRTPGDVRLLNALAWLLATAPDPQARDGAEALRLAQQAQVGAGQPYVSILDTLAAAYAELGRYDEAVETAERALTQARGGEAERLVEGIEKRLALYRQGRPYRQAVEN